MSQSKGLSNAFKLRDIVDLREPAFGGKLDGVTDDTAALHAAMATLNPDATSAFGGASGRGGIVYIPAGVPVLGDVVMKSNISIRGAGAFATRIKPKAGCTDVFTTSGTTTASRMANVTLRDFMIGPNDSCTVEVTPTNTKPSCGGIKFTYVTVCAVENVWIHNIAGTAYSNTETFESFFKYCVASFCGTATVPAVTCYQGTADVTNDVRFEHLIVACPFMLKVGAGSGGTLLQQRTLSFMGGYFEWGQGADAATGPAIVIEASRCVKFVGCDFIANRITAQSLIKFQDSGGSSDVAVSSLDGCGFIGQATMTGKLIENAATRVINIGVHGCNFSDVLGGPCISGPSFNITGFSAYDCLGPMIDVSSSILSGIKAGAISGTGVAIKLNGCVASGISLDSFQGNGTTGIQCVTAASIIDNVKIALGGGGTDKGIDFQVAGNKVSNVALSSTTPYTGIASFQSSNWYEEDGSFTMTATGMTTSPTGTCYYARRGKTVTLDIGAVSGTSNSVAFTLTGGPAVMAPATQKNNVVRCQDNGAAYVAALIATEVSGVLSVYPTTNGGNFTAAGTKSIAAASITYTMN